MQRKFILIFLKSLMMPCLLLALIFSILTAGIIDASADNGISLETSLISLNHQKFPFVYLSAAVDISNGAIPILPKSNFQVYENQILQTNYFDVIPPEQAGGIRLADIIFLMDNSGSMYEEQEAVRDNVIAFVNDLSASGVDFALGLLRFGAIQNRGDPIIEDNGNLTADAEYFKNNVWARNVINGWYEPGWDALYQAATIFNFRPGAQKVFILITDETVTNCNNQGNYSQSQVISLLQTNSITTFALINLSQPYQSPDYAIADYGVIAEQTNGQYFDIYSPFDQILDYISAQVSNTYRLVYKSSNPVFDGAERQVKVIVSYQGKQDSCEGFYTPGSAPIIQRTEDTLALHNQAWTETTGLAIKAYITDEAAPDVQSATLYFRKTGNPSYSSVAMSIYSADQYGATIPASAAQAPGLDYYISATDGQSAVSDPSLNAPDNPYQLAILPNIAPEIIHTAVTILTPATAIGITAQVLDNTNYLALVKLAYRRTGQLIYQEVEMDHNNGNNYSAEIAAEYATEAGVDYYLYAQDDLGVGNYHGTPDNPYYIAAEISQDFSFIHLTDIHLGSNYAKLAKLFDHDWYEELSYPRFADALYEISKMANKPDFILIGGDNVEYNKKSWLKDFKSMVEGFTEQANIAVYAIPGNHDRYKRAACSLPALVGGNDNLENYHEIIVNPDNVNLLFEDSSSWTESKEQGVNKYNYEFQHNDYQFIGLDSGEDVFPPIPPPEGRGLHENHIDALIKLNQNKPDMPRIIFIHHPVINPVGDTECEGCISERRQEFINFTTSSNVQLVLSGHTHEDHVFDKDSVDHKGEDLLELDIRPLFIQTQSATKDTDDLHGYRIIDIKNGIAYPHDADKTNFYSKIIGQLKTEDDLSFKVYDPNNPANYITPEDKSGLSAPFFAAAATNRVILYEYNNDSKFAVKNNSSSDGEYELLIEKRDKKLTEVDGLKVNGFKVINNQFCGLFGCSGGLLALYLDQDKGISLINMQDMEISNISEHLVKVNWSELNNSTKNNVAGLNLTVNGNSATSFEKYWRKLTIDLDSPGELQVYDSAGKVTGLVDEEVEEEIPYSLYFPMSETVVIFSDEELDNNSYSYQVVGNYEDSYSLAIILDQEGQEEASFIATNIPINDSATHQYTIDWQALAQGDEGVTLQIDADGDGDFEQTITANNEFTQADYLANIPQWLKEETKQALGQAKTGDKKIDNKIDKVLNHLEKSLTESWWQDQTHLHAQKGRKVFQAEAQAVIKIKLILGASKRRKKCGLPEEARVVFEQAIEDLVKADRILAQVALNEAKNTPVNNQKYQKVYDKMIAWAEVKMNKAEKYEESHPALSIRYYRQAWGHAQKAIQYANRK
ncbi:metallophosphoesterase [Candidatus Parcubacteria bacterium]|nr:metallophosphoesterase [Candidatus Parcubacteria bacterium]